MRTRLWLPILVALALVVAACGGGEPAATPKAEQVGPTPTPIPILPTPTPKPPPPTPTPAPTNTPVPTPTPKPGETPTEPPPTPTVELVPRPVEHMVTIPAGEFLMGADDREDDERPAHTVFVEEFAIDVHEVTNEEFAFFVEQTGYVTEAEQAGESETWRTYFTEGRERHPVVKVTWADADAYCRWAGKRLPTEAEWEKAARGTDGRIYPWGNDWDPAKANSRESGYRGTLVVGSLPDGASPYGVMDMAGNVWEWTADWYDAYPGSPTTSPYFGQQYRVTRGGGWFSDPSHLRTSNRSATAPEARNDDLGFRCAR